MIAGEIALTVHGEDCPTFKLVNDIYRAMAAVAPKPVHSPDRWDHSLLKQVHPQPLMPVRLRSSVPVGCRRCAYLKLAKPELALVEYEAALKMDPNRALALFGRGVARDKLGKTTEAKADKDAARALSPGIGSQFTAYGID